MRDLLADLEAGDGPGEPDPMRRAQRQMRQKLARRFYRAVSVGPVEGGHAVLLDGRPVRTPGKAVLVLPGEAAARLVAGEFAAQRDEIDPATMPAMRIANSAVDGVAGEVGAVAADIVRYAGSDLVCYRAGDPAGLVERQSRAWDPVLAWARERLGARFVLAEGVMHVAQPAAAIESVTASLAARPDPFRIACLHVMTTLGGSALIALALEDGALGVDAAWAAAHVDEDWNIALWGEDAEAARRRQLRRREMDAAAALLAALPGRRALISAAQRGPNVL